MTARQSAAEGVAGPPPVTANALLSGGARQARGRLLLLTVLMLVRGGLALAAPALLATAVDAMLTGGSLRPALLCGAVLVGGAVLETLLSPLAATASARGTRWLRLRAMRHFLGLGARPPLQEGEAVTHLTQAAPQAGSLPVSAVSWAVSLSGALGGFVALWLIDWQVGLAFTVAVPVVVLLAKLFVGRAVRAHDAYLAAQAGIATRLMTALSGARTIRACGTLQAENERVLAPLADVSAAGRRMWGLQRNVVWQLTLLASLTEATVLAVAGLGVVHGRVSPGAMLAVIGYLALAFQGVQQIEGLYGLAMARSAAGRIARALSAPAVDYGDRPVPAGPGALSLRSVTVLAAGQRTAAGEGGGSDSGEATDAGSGNGAPLLDRLDLEIPGGSAVGLVGLTGSGKSLLARLPGRLTDPDAGEVLLDGVPVRELSRAALRSAVTYAFEEPRLVGATLADALGYGAQEGSGRTPDVRAAAVAARADRFVRLLPEGYDTPLADAPMSGGERQRLGLARTLARDARVYVLDDATSGLDTVTEAEVSAALTSALAGRTRLVVARRVATAARCDLVAWLADGRVRELAPHRELWRHAEYRAVFGAGEGDAAENAPTTGEEAACPAR
ncbi:ABC transporter ATP-binding protein [Streptomyces lonarensis]|uniref:ABC transporter ATP-binding protein n=1 Tax=Streptomyces lonarensis TaxID=700599 RepID=A0A7X6HXF5_9ACTN|nr:ABC transporter ATP-binding protein [Streptomyces lonarensis]NJQ04486.1 ABC transporter ATP-binding protein [Streptomyces lonarensis]